MPHAATAIAAAPGTIRPEDHVKLLYSIAWKVARQTGADVEECQQNGAFGLLKAAATFDPSRGCAFTTHAFWYIRGAMLSALSADPMRAVSLDDEKRSLDHTEVPELSGWKINPRFERPGQHDALRQALSRLPSRLQFVIERRYHYGEELHEIARALGVSRERVRQLHVEAIERLRSLLTYGHGGGGRALAAGRRQSFRDRLRLTVRRTRRAPGSGRLRKAERKRAEAGAR